MNRSLFSVFLLLLRYLTVLYRVTVPTANTGGRCFSTGLFKSVFWGIPDSTDLITIFAGERSITIIRYESDDVIWLRNHASTWILVPNIGCKQTMASNTGGPLTFSFLGVHTFFFLITPRQYEEEKFRSNQTMLLKEILRLPIAE